MEPAKIIDWTIGIFLLAVLLLGFGLPFALNSVTGSGFDWSNITLAKNASGSVTSSINLGGLGIVLVLLIVVGAFYMVYKAVWSKKRDK